MKVAVHKRRGDQPIRSIDLPTGLHLKLWSDVDNATVVNRNIDTRAAIGKVGVSNN
jgi:hypothetical protein